MMVNIMDIFIEKEHNPKINKTRWVSVYGGNTRLIAYGLSTN